MRIALNATILRAPRTGIGHYLAELVRALSAHHELELRLFTGLGWRSELPATALPGYSLFSSFIKRVIPDAYALRRLVEQHRFSKGSVGMDLYHEPSLWPFEFDGPMVMTLHDLSHVHYRHTQPADRVAAIERHVSSGISRAKRILVDSVFIGDEACRYYGIPAEKIVVAPLGCASRFHPRTKEQLMPKLQPLGLQAGKYILCVGTLEPRKNLQLALQAHDRLPVSIREHYPLVIVGMAGWHQEQLTDSLRRALAGGNVRVLGYQDDITLAHLVAGARLLLFPSVYEGFGLPVLESMTSGVPVVVSNCSSLPELAGAAGIYINPDDDNECSQAMELLIEDHNHWQRHSEAGLLQAKNFSWQRCAKITANVYQQVVGS